MRKVWTFPLSGILAGAVSVLAFTWIHGLLISDIWFFITPMIVAGAICGLCVAGSFAIIAPALAVRPWILYNATYIGLLALLGVLSVLIFEPVTTVEALINNPRGLEEAEHLMGQAMPLTVGFAIAGAFLVGWLFGRRWWHFGPVLVAMAVVMAIFGLNISILGFAETTAPTVYSLLLVFVLIAATVGVYAAVVTAMEWRRLGDSWMTVTGESR